MSSCFRYASTQAAPQTLTSGTSRQTGLILTSCGATSPAASLACTLNLQWWRAACTQYVLKLSVIMFASSAFTYQLCQTSYNS